MQAISGFDECGLRVKTIRVPQKEHLIYLLGITLRPQPPTWGNQSIRRWAILVLPYAHNYHVKKERKKKKKKKKRGKSEKKKRKRKSARAFVTGHKTGKRAEIHPPRVENIWDACVIINYTLLPTTIPTTIRFYLFVLNRTVFCSSSLLFCMGTVNSNAI